MNIEVRKAYTAQLLELMKQNDKIVVLDADLSAAGGTKVIYNEFPNRAFNVGIAEANMTNVAVGLSASGFVPFIHSFAPFVSRRNFDQIAVGISYSNQNVKIMAFDPGITTTYNGGTHMTFEDVSAMRSLPNITVVDIVDNVQIAKLLPQIAESPEAMYVRFPRKQTESFFDSETEIVLGKANKLSDGKDITIIVSGTLAFDTQKAVEELKSEGISVDFLVLNTIKPLDEEAIISSAKKTNRVLTVENHSVHGGLYSAVCELLSREYPTKCDAIAVYNKVAQVGNLADLKKDYNLTTEDIVAKAKNLIK